MSQVESGADECLLESTRHIAKIRTRSVAEGGASELSFQHPDADFVSQVLMREESRASPAQAPLRRQGDIRKTKS